MARGSHSSLALVDEVDVEGEGERGQNGEYAAGQHLVEVALEVEGYHVAPKVAPVVDEARPREQAQNSAQSGKHDRLQRASSIRRLDT